MGAALSRFTIERGAHADFYFLTDIETQCAPAPCCSGCSCCWRWRCWCCCSCLCSCPCLCSCCCCGSRSCSYSCLCPCSSCLCRGLTHHPSLRLEIEAGSATTTDNAYQELQDASAFPASGPPPPRLQRTEIVTITSTSCPESAHIWPDQVHVNRVLSCPVSVRVFASSREDLSKDRTGTG